MNDCCERSNNLQSTTDKYSNALSVAVLDLGTQTFRMAVLSVKTDPLTCEPGITPVVSLLRHVRLGENLIKTGRISHEAFQRGMNALKEFHEVIRPMPFILCRAVGTQALRQAQNTQAFLDAALELGFEIQILTHEQEAELTALGVRHSLPHLYDGCAIMDLGGGSVEFIVPQAEGLQVTAAALGCVGLLEAFPGLKPPHHLAVGKAASDHVRHVLARACGHLQGIQALVAVGGAATSVAFLASGLEKYDAAQIRGFKIPRDLLTNVWHQLADLPQQKKLEKILGNRLDILPAGIFILSHTLDLLNLDQFVVSDSGLLFGLFIKVIKEHLHVEPSHTTGIYI